MTKILVIEDEFQLREDMVDSLNYSHYDVIAAANGEEGVKLARQHIPDIILCDIRMPVMDGFGVLQQLRDDALTAPIPFIFITAQNDRETMRNGMQLGADDFIAKPFHMSELLSAVQARLARRDTFVRDAESKLESAKQRLTRMVAHELKTPLISMNTVLDVVSQRVGSLNDGELQNLIASMDAGGRRLSHVVEQMVLVTQLESGALQRATLAQKGTPMTVAQLLEGGITLGRRFCADRADVQIVVEDFDTSLQVLCHQQPLKHALGELIANALKFSPSSVNVLISGWRAGRAAWLTITDCGAGMDAAQLEQIGAGFTQLDRDKREQQGMGMGLLLAQRIVKLHGGILDLRSEQNVGTQAQVGLPVLGA